MEFTIRLATNDELREIIDLHKKAFGQDFEGKLVENLIHCEPETISIVAECQRELLGHLLLSKIDAPISALALAPVAVLPDHQNKGIGNALIREAIRLGRDAGYQAMFVLGEPAYYTRFGFDVKLAKPFESPWQGKNFMALELKKAALQGKSGKLVYPPAFFEQ